MRIGKTQVDAILAHALRGYPFEVCGVLLGRASDGASVTRVVEVANRETKSPRVRYQIAPEDLLRVQDVGRNEGLEVLGYYHTHPDHPARPSETDRRIAAEGLSDGVFHLVVGVSAGVEATPAGFVFRDTSQAFTEVPLEVVP